MLKKQLSKKAVMHLILLLLEYLIDKWKFPTDQMIETFLWTQNIFGSTLQPGEKCQTVFVIHPMNY